MRTLKLTRPNSPSPPDHKTDKLLQTIRLPKNLKNLGDRLPRPQYDQKDGDPGRKLTAQYNTDKSLVELNV